MRRTLGWVLGVSLFVCGVVTAGASLHPVFFAEHRNDLLGLLSDISLPAGIAAAILLFLVSPPDPNETSFVEVARLAGLAVMFVACLMVLVGDPYLVIAIAMAVVAADLGRRVIAL